VKEADVKATRTVIFWE